MNTLNTGFPFLDNLNSHEFLSLVLLLIVWELVWKGFALWHSARRHEMNWFIALLVINSVGILPIVYLLLNKDSVKR